MLLILILYKPLYPPDIHQSPFYHSPPILGHLQTCLWLCAIYPSSCTRLNRCRGETIHAYPLIYGRSEFILCLDWVSAVGATVDQTRRGGGGRGRGVLDGIDGVLPSEDGEVFQYCLAGGFGVFDDGQGAVSGGQWGQTVGK